MLSAQKMHRIPWRQKKKMTPYTSHKHNGGICGTAYGVSLCGLRNRKSSWLRFLWTTTHHSIQHHGILLRRAMGKPRVASAQNQKTTRGQRDRSSHGHGRNEMLSSLCAAAAPTYRPSSLLRIYIYRVLPCRCCCPRSRRKEDLP